MQTTETTCGEIRQKRSFIGRIMVNSNNNWEGLTNFRKWAEAEKRQICQNRFQGDATEEPDLQHSSWAVEVATDLVGRRCTVTAVRRLSSLLLVSSLYFLPIKLSGGIPR